MSTFAFDETMRAGWTREGDGDDAGEGWRFELPGGWGQGRAVFGGLTVAAAASLALRVSGASGGGGDDERPLRTISSQLLRPLSAGGIEGRCRRLREGKNVTFLEVRLAQGGQEALVASVVLAKPRAGALVVPPAPRWEGPAVETLKDLPYVPGMMPECTQHIAYRWANGAYPYTGADEARFAGYCRLRVPYGGVEGLLGLLDAWPNPSVVMLKGPAAESTVSWTAHLLALPPPEAFDEGWFAFEYETICGAAGFHTIVGRLHAPDGALVGWTEQLLALFA